MYQYDLQLIQKRITEFKLRVSSSSIKPTIWFDMDNTLYVYSIYGKIDTALRECYSKNYYKNLPIYPEGPDVITALLNMGYDCGICSTVINSPYCETEKRESIGYYFPMIPKENIILSPEGVNKVDKIPDVEYSLLIDDWHENIEHMFELGGIGVKKSYSRKKRSVPVIHSLVDIFVVLHNLGCLS